MKRIGYRNTTHAFPLDEESEVPHERGHIELTKFRERSSTSTTASKKRTTIFRSWWLLTFYGAIAFGLVYWFYFHVYSHR